MTRLFFFTEKLQISVSHPNVIEFMNPFISVIIPAYNREKTIGQCIKSVINSTYKNIEVIIIDDGSTDGTLSVCRKFEEIDKRISVISQANKGVSAARNHGMYLAKGEWISFIDSDDAVISTYYQRIAELPNLDELDLLWVGHASGCIVDNDIIFEKNICEIHSSYINGNLNIINWIFSNFKNQKNQFFNVWDKLFKLKRLKETNLQFNPDITLTEDQIFVLNYLKTCESLYYTSEPYYITLNWSEKDRTYTLGGKLRTPEYYIYIQESNYWAFQQLYEQTRCKLLKEYQVNYIFDRPITRILFRYLILYNIKRCSFIRLKRVVEARIKPIFLMEYSNLFLVNNSKIRKYANLIVNKSFWYVYFTIFFSENLSYYLHRIKVKLFP